MSRLNPIDTIAYLKGLLVNQGEEAFIKQFFALTKDGFVNETMFRSIIIDARALAYDDGIDANAEREEQAEQQQRIRDARWG
jgi:hypothetical protein